MTNQELKQELAEVRLRLRLLLVFGNDVVRERIEAFMAAIDLRASREFADMSDEGLLRYIEKRGL